jgi:hypothetical protein
MWIAIEDFFEVRHFFASKMSDSDGYMSSSESSNVQESESSDETIWTISYVTTL